MTDLNAPFAPDWVSPPGETLLDLLEERGWTQAELAQRLGYTEKHVSQLINGKVPLSMDAAQRLARVVGSTADFWLAREANYQKRKARLEVAGRLQHDGLVEPSWMNDLKVSFRFQEASLEK